MFLKKKYESEQIILQYAFPKISNLMKNEKKIFNFFKKKKKNKDFYQKHSLKTLELLTYHQFLILCFLYQKII